MTEGIQKRDTRTATALSTVTGAFEKHHAGTGLLAPAWLQPFREAAIETFRETGFPARKDENWKYTNLTGFAERTAEYLQNEPAQASNGFIDELLDKLPQIDDEIRVVFINGLHRPELSTAVDSDCEVILTPYSAANSIAGEQIFRDQPVDDNAMIALNTAFLADGLAIHLDAGKSIAAPIHVIFASDGQPAAAQPRLSVDIGRGANALIVQHHIGTGESLTNAVTSINCAEDSRLFFVRLQNESSQSMHVANHTVRVAANSHLDNVSIDFGAQLARHDLDVDLHGKRAHANLYGLFMSDGKRHVDNHLHIDHCAPDTTSQENYRGIMNDSARGVFNGKIIVHPGADGTDAQMSNRNLLLGERAEIDTKPELEIYTDEVKCSHGSTTGQLDMDSMFYLRARGIPEAVARTMLVGAFAQEIIEHVRIRIPSLADYLSNLINQQLPDNA